MCASMVGGLSIRSGNGRFGSNEPGTGRHGCGGGGVRSECSVYQGKDCWGGSIGEYGCGHGTLACVPPSGLITAMLGLLMFLFWQDSRQPLEESLASAFGRVSQTEATSPVSVYICVGGAVSLGEGPKARNLRYRETTTVISDPRVFVASDMFYWTAFWEWLALWYLAQKVVICKVRN